MEWKDNAPYVLCLSHDVDRVTKQWYHYCFYGLKHPMVQLKSLIGKIKGKEPYWNFEDLIELEKSYGVKSTFFFLNEKEKKMSANFWGRYNISSPKVVNIIKTLDYYGYEIGLHGSFYSYDNLELIRHEKIVLEDIVGHEIVSGRQHHLNFNDKKTWNIHKEIGIKYDSTMGYSNKVGEEKYYRTKEGIIEIPITLMDTVDMTEEVFDTCCNVALNGGIMMLNFHQCHFNRIEYPKNVEMYVKILNRARKDGAWITNVKEVGEWLNERI